MMVYFKLTDERGFVSVSTLNADSGGNCTRAEHDTIAEMYRNAEPGYGVIETEKGFVYAARPVEPEPMTDEQALTRYANELTGHDDPDLISAAETLIEQRIKGASENA